MIIEYELVDKVLIYVELKLEIFFGYDVYKLHVPLTVSGKCAIILIYAFVNFLLERR